MNRQMYDHKANNRWNRRVALLSMILAVRSFRTMNFHSMALVVASLKTVESWPKTLCSLKILTKPPYKH
jgi:hypothetical protein